MKQNRVNNISELKRKCITWLQCYYSFLEIMEIMTSLTTTEELLNPNYSLQNFFSPILQYTNLQYNTPWQSRISESGMEDNLLQTEQNMLWVIVYESWQVRLNCEATMFSVHQINHPPSNISIGRITWIIVLKWITMQVHMFKDTTMLNIHHKKFLYTQRKFF